MRPQLSSAGTLIATQEFISRWRARQTAPWPPAPSVLSRRYLPASTAPVLNSSRNATTDIADSSRSRLARLAPMASDARALAERCVARHVAKTDSRPRSSVACRMIHDSTVPINALRWGSRGSDDEEQER